MNANLLLNSISFPLASNKLDQVKKIILDLPWVVVDNKEACEKRLIADGIHGRWLSCPPSDTRKHWFMSVELNVKDYLIILTCQDHPSTQFKNKLSWKQKSDILAMSKEW